MRLFFGVFVFTFVLSGLFSVVDFHEDKSSGEQAFDPVKLWNKGQKTEENAQHSFIELWQALETKNGVRKLEWETSMGEPAWYIYYNNYQLPEVYITTHDTIVKQQPYTLQQVEKRAAKLFGNTSYTISVQSEFDNYYQSSGMFERPLPVYKVYWNNEAKNLIYIDPATGKVLTSYTQSSKLHRWLYQGLHKFNFQFLMEHNWLRILLLVVVSLGGIMVSFSGVVLSWKWIKRKTERKKL